MDNKEKLSAVDFVSSFLVRFKIPLILLLIVILIFLIGLAVGSVVMTQINQKNIALAEEILDAYSELESAEEENKEEAKAVFSEVVEKGKSLRKGSYAFVRAVLCESQMYESENKKEEALDALSVLLNLKNDLYLIPIGLHRAAILAEKLNKNDEALMFYNAIAQMYDKTYFNMDRIYFNMARLEEAAGNSDQAKQIYEKLIQVFSSQSDADSPLISIAKDRLIYLERDVAEDDNRK